MTQQFVVPFALMLALGLGTASVLAEDSNRGDRHCRSVGGVLLPNFIDQANAVAAVTGDLAGGVRATIVRQTETAGGLLELQLQHVFATQSGDLLLTSDRAILTPIKESRFYVEMVHQVSGGAGRFERASGSFSSVGSIDLGSGRGVLRYSGKVCGVELP